MNNPIWASIFSSNSSEKDFTTLLQEVPAFDGLEKRELVLIAKSINRRNYASGETIFYEGAPGAALYIVKEGRVSITKDINDDKTVELAKISSPSFFGEIALIDESPRSAGAVAEGNTVLLAFGKPDLEHLIDTHPRVATKIVLNIARLLSKRLVYANQSIEELSQGEG